MGVGGEGLSTFHRWATETQRGEEMQPRTYSKKDLVRTEIQACCKSFPLVHDDRLLVESGWTLRHQAAENLWQLHRGVHLEHG